MAVKIVHGGRRLQHKRQDRTSLVPAQLVMSLLFLVALIAFEIFNFDTTRYALHNLLGTASFARLSWAAVLAIAFCAIDFAGLIRFFLPEAEDEGTPVEVWYLMGAWLLGATMNAVMTWWAVSLTLLDHELGNEILSRTQLLEIVPVFVAVLVWLTRILFIGAFTVAGGHLLDLMRPARKNQSTRPESRQLRPNPWPSRPSGLRPVTDELPPFLRDDGAEAITKTKAKRVPRRQQRPAAQPVRVDAAGQREK